MKKVLLALLILFVSVSTGFASVSDDAVSFWRFDEDTGTSVSDEMGVNDGTIYGATWVSGKLGTALDFDGTDDYVDIPDDDSLSFGDGQDDSPFTFAGWINMDDATRFEIISKGDYNSNNKEYSFETLPGDQLYIILVDNQQSNARIGRKYTAALTSYEGEWIHVAATYSGNGSSTGLKLYLNGTRVDNANVNFDSYISMENQATAVAIGARNLAADVADGTIDELGVWDTALSTEEIAELVAEGKGKYWTVSGLLKGSIKGANTVYNDENTVTIASGNGECNGSYWEIPEAMDYDMTTLASVGDFHYIYIDDDESDYPTVTIIDSTTEPSWSDAKQGWYNEDDRCISVVWCKSNEKIMNFIAVENGSLVNVVFNTYSVALLEGVAGTGSWVTLTNASNYVPVNATTVKIDGRSTDYGSHAYLKVSSVELYNAYVDFHLAGYHQPEKDGWVSLGISRDLAWRAESNDTYVAVRIGGFQYKR